MEIEKIISGKVLGVTEFGCSELELLIMLPELLDVAPTKDYM